MANPQVHSRSSARKFGGVWQHYIDLHSFFDSSKLHIADARHRALLHHEYGSEIAKRIFGSYIAGVAIQPVIDQHLNEDFTRKLPTVADWFEEFDHAVGPAPVLSMSRDEQCEKSVKMFGGKPEDYIQLHQFLDEPAHMFPETFGAMAITHSTFGLGLVEQVFGYVIGPREVPSRTVAEKHILAEFGKIPSAQDWLIAITVRPWMYNQAAAVSQGFEFAEPAAK